MVTNFLMIQTSIKMTKRNRQINTWVLDMRLASKHMSRKKRRKRKNQNEILLTNLITN